jgi:hypothetical protein
MQKSIDTALSRSAGWAKEKIGGNGKKKKKKRTDGERE